MNIFKIVYKDIKKFMMEKTILFVVLMISLIVTALAFCIFIANNMHMANIMNEYRNVSNKYTISNKKKINKESVNKLNKWLEEKNYNDIKVNLYSDILLRDDVDVSIFQSDGIHLDSSKKDNNNDENFAIRMPYDIIIGMNNNVSSRESFIGKTMAEEDVNNYIMIDINSEEASRDPFVLNNTIKIRNKDYIVKSIDRIDITPQMIDHCNVYNYNKGTLGYIEPVAVKMSDFMNNYDIYTMDLIVPNSLKKSQKEEIGTFIQENFKNDEISLPQRIEDVKLSDIQSDIIMFSVLVILALINILALFIYWIDKNWRKYIIYRICGANQKNIYKIIILEATVICIISIIIGVTIYYLITPLLAKMYTTYILALKDICLFQLIVVVLVIYITSIEAIKISKISPRYMERR